MQGVGARIWEACSKRVDGAGKGEGSTLLRGACRNLRAFIRAKVRPQACPSVRWTLWLCCVPPQLAPAPPPAPLAQLPACFFWELQYRAIVPNQQLGAWEELEVANGGMEVEVTGLDPGTKYAFRWVGEGGPACVASPVQPPGGLQRAEAGS